MPRRPSSVEDRAQQAEHDQVARSPAATATPTAAAPATTVQTGRTPTASMRAAAGGEIVAALMRRHDAEDPVGAQIERQREREAGADHREGQHQDARREQPAPSPRATDDRPSRGRDRRGGLIDDRRRRGQVHEEDRGGESHPEVERENHAMLRAAQQRPHAERHDRRRQSPPAATTAARQRMPPRAARRLGTIVASSAMRRSVRKYESA